MSKTAIFFFFLFILSKVCCGQVDTIKPIYLIYDTSHPAPKPGDTMSTSMKKALKLVEKTAHIFSYAEYNDRRVDKPLAGPIAFEGFKGKKIRNITIKILYPFGTELDSSGQVEYTPTKFQAFANRTQFKTKPWVIRNELLFKEGDEVDPLSFSDTERNLWLKNVYKDLKIEVHETDDDQVDVTIYVRDRWNWSLNTDVDFHHISTGPVFSNMFGYPQSFNISAAFNLRKDNLYTIAAIYTYSNILATHIDAIATFRYDNLQRGAQIVVTRPYFSGKAQWGARMILNYYDQREIVPWRDAAAVVAPNKVNFQDFWLAKTFQLPGEVGNRHPQFKLITAARLIRTAYPQRPYMYNIDRTISFLNQTSLIGAIGFAQWDYYIDHNVYTLIKSEYFPKGLSGAILGGFQDDEELGRRTYTGAALQYGHYIPHIGYILTQFKYGGFINANRYEQVLIDFQNTYYSVHQKAGKYSFRHIVNLNGRWGANRPYGRELVLDNWTGLRGFYSNVLRGSSTYALDYEVDFFAPKKILGFTSSMFIFCDFAIIQQSINDNKYQPGIGIGFRFRNVNLNVDFVQLMVAYYPALNLTTQPSYNLLGMSKNDRAPQNRDLFEPTILSVD